jgi:sulfate/thiosulfate transport system substrate-binding protein
MPSPVVGRHRWAGAAAIALLIAGLPSAAHAARPSAGVDLTLVAYSTPTAAFATLIPAFEKTSAGKNITFHTSFGASGTQSRAVVAGLAADVVNFSLSPDVARLVSAGLVAKNWNAGPLKGMVTDSVVVLVVRKGNPKHIQTWDDLLKPGVDVITPNPFTSGGARWNVMAAYGAELQLKKSPSAATTYLKNLFAHVSVQSSSAREELQTFVGGKGDVMIDYEDDTILAQKKGAKIDYIVPDQTILIENPIAVISSGSHVAQATAFVSWLQSPAGQTIWGQQGYRPVLPAVAKTFTFPTPKDLFTIDSLGGWTKVTKQFFDPQNGIMAQIERGRGVSTGS